MKDEPAEHLGSRGKGRQKWRNNSIFEASDIKECEWIKEWQYKKEDIGDGFIIQIIVEMTRRWKENKWLELSNLKISQRMNLVIIGIKPGYEKLDFSRVILQSIPIRLR